MNVSTTEGVAASAEPTAGDLVGRERRTVRMLVETAAARHLLETQGEAQFEAELRHAKKTLSDREILLNRDLGLLRQKAEAEFAEKAAAHRAAFDEVHTQAENDYEDAGDRADYEHRSALEKLRKHLKDTRWEAQAVAESSEQGAKEEFQDVRKEIADSRERSGGVWGELQVVLHRLQRSKLLTESESKQAEAPAETVEESAEPPVVAESENAEPPPAESAPAADDANVDLMGRVNAKIDDASLRLKMLRAAWLPKIARGDVVCWPFVAAGMIGIYPLGQQMGWSVGPFVSAIGATVIGTAFGLWFVGLGTAWTRRRVRDIVGDLDEAERLRREHYGRQNARFRRTVSDIRRALFGDVRAAETRYETNKRRTEKEYKSTTDLRAAAHQQAAEKRKRTFEAERAAMQAEYDGRLAGIAKSERETLEAHRQECERKIGDIEDRRRRAWEAMTERWQRTLKRGAGEFAAVVAGFEQHFPAWDDEIWERWEPSGQYPQAAPFGESKLNLALIPDGPPKDSRFAREPTIDGVWPAAIRFPGQSLMFKATGKPLDDANATIQNVMLRLLTGLPPGKVKFTIVDPVGLGQNFAAFMHLADYEESLVHHRIWTEQGFIEKALAEITAHMETVIQKYLRNEFENIADYNEQAGEIAEPYRFVVVANFPVGFTEAAARRLISIVTSGERCGVRALISLDAKQPLPNGCNLADLEQRCANVVWGGAKGETPRWLWRDPDFERLPLALGKPPDDELASKLLHRVGALAKIAMKVQVPFEAAAPPPEKWWKGDTSRVVEVPLGRAGATKLQALKLGEGTSQHALIAGRTGSGKSTLLHALVTNLALIYSPDELEVYLIDFKKGVEFKTYANHQLPHAKVIAIESEREFGLSAMQRLDGELKIRGDLYRKIGVQDLAGYRAARAADPSLPVLPRILLIVDEFQEFFIEDDRVAQECALLMDRLVRQGRAFGIHVNLGSQTLGGAYSLARSTLGQMAVRIALQCSETDAHLILSEDNSAARLLTRPGEAIYNDSNGAVEGNHPFQVVWLPDDRREYYLDQVQKLAQKHGYADRSPPIVFEGNAPAVLGANRMLGKLLDGPWPTPGRTVSAWLGDAIAIKDPTSADFHAHTGSNLLLVGQHTEASLAIFVSALASLGAQLQPQEGLPPRVAVLNGMPTDSPGYELFGKLAESCPSLRVGGIREAAEYVNEVATELARRTAEPNAEYPPVFLFVYDLPRFRAFRRNEDDYGFGSSRGDAPPDPGKQLISIVREGPAVGVHLVTWCDTLNNLHRTFDRATLREFDMRVLFQMSGNDSSTLIDSPAASKLGFHRAFLASEEQARLEKFRPYGLPEAAWYDRWNEAMRRRKS